MKTHRVLAWLFTGFTAVGSATLFAQVPGGSPQLDPAQQQRQANQAAQVAGGGEPELYPGEGADTGPQMVIHLKPRPTHFETQADIQFFHTDNFFFADVNAPIKASTTVLASTVQFALAPTAYPLGSGTFSPRAGFRHQFYNFSVESKGQPVDYSALDFHAQTAFLEGSYRFDEHWTAEAGADYTRLFYFDTHDTFYAAWSPHWGVQCAFSLCPKAAAAMGYQGLYHFVDNDNAVFPMNSTNRLDNILFANLSVAVCRYFVAQPYYRFKHTHFMDVFGGREDYLHSLGLGLYAFLTQRLSVRAFLNYDLRNSSNRYISDYRKLDLGGGANFTVRF
jgi:hypothetical protein